jgi:hypothetical protein
VRADEERQMNRTFGQAFFGVFTAALWALSLAGCAPSNLDVSLETHHDSPPYAVAPLTDAIIGVDAFLDMRPQRRGSENKTWMGFIPGVLYLEIDSDLPEIYTAYSTFNSRPFSFSVPEAVSKTIGDAGICRNVVFLPEDPYARVDYRLEGVLRRSLVRETGYYYGSSVYAWVTRILGLPYVSYAIVLDVDLRLRSMETNDVIWVGKISGTREDKYHSVYGLAMGKEGKDLLAYNFSRILSEQMPGVLSGLRETLRSEGR